jgi:membrane protease YdiL (CAAX protease family)
MKLFKTPQYNPNIWPLPINLQIIVFGLGFLGLSIIATSLNFLLDWIVTLSINGEPIIIDQISKSTIVNTVSYFILFIILLSIVFPYLKKYLSTFIDLSNIFKGIGFGLLIIAAGIALNLLYMLLNVELEPNINQEMVSSMMIRYPLPSVLAFVIAGPIVEELTYRWGLFAAIYRKNRLLAYIFTFMIFGLIHFNFATDNIVNELLNLPFYTLAGILFCYAYERHGLHVAIYAHIINNGVSFIVTLYFAETMLRVL